MAESVSVGTRLEIRLQQPISSYATEKGTKISGVLVAPLTEGGEMLLHRTEMSVGNLDDAHHQRSLCSGLLRAECYRRVKVGAGPVPSTVFPKAPSRFPHDFLHFSGIIQMVPDRDNCHIEAQHRELLRTFFDWLNAQDATPHAGPPVSSEAP